MNNITTLKPYSTLSMEILVSSPHGIMSISIDGDVADVATTGRFHEVLVESGEEWRAERLNDALVALCQAVIR